jgi:hypothetical protein
LPSGTIKTTQQFVIFDRAQGFPFAPDFALSRSATTQKQATLQSAAMRAQPRLD